MLKLLIADDEPLERQALRFIFEKSERNISIVGEAADGRQTLELTKRLRPDIVFMDIKMPDLDGLEATREIKECHPNAKIIILTAHGEFFFAQQALRLGAVDYILKPARPADLLSVLDRAVAAIFLERRDRQLREMLEDALPYIQMAFVNDLITGTILCDAEAHERARLIGLNSYPALAMAIDIDHFSAWSRNLSEAEKVVAKDEVFRLVKQAMSVHNDYLIAPQTGHKLALLVSISEDRSDSAAKQRAIEIGESIRQTVQRNSALSVTIGIGRRYRHPQDLAKSYSEALTALRYKLFLGRNRIIHIDDIDADRVERDSLPYEEETQLCTFVKAGDLEGALRCISDIIRQILDGKARNPDFAKSRVLELLVLSSRAAVEGGADPVDLQGASLRYAQELISINASTELEDWLVGCVKNIIAAVASGRQIRNKSIINRAARFIRENCTRDLTLDQVAEVANLSPFYFSRIFKQEQGCTFVEFLARSRIDEAKKLLRTTKLTVTDISFAVGYQDPNYFTQLFRHYEGITPTQYRRIAAQSFRSWSL